MKASRRMEGDVAVIALSGKLMGGPDAEGVRQVIRESLDEGTRKILVDVGEVSWVNSTGLGILISSLAAVTDAGGKMKLCRVSHRVHQIFMVTKLHQVFDAHETVEEALKGFAG